MPAPPPRDLPSEPPASDRFDAPRPSGRLVARGAAENPANRFERMHVAMDPELLAQAEADGEELPPVPTVYLRDPSRTILAHNQSPDVGFDTSVNPYRGCEHGCTYCLDPATLVLHADMVWRPLGDVRVGDTLVGFDERPAPGRCRRIRPAVVEHVWGSRKPALRMVTRNSEVVTTAEHRWLQYRSHRWSRTEELSPGRLLRHMPVVPEEGFDEDYRIGYVAAMTLGDGTFRYQPGQRSDKKGFLHAYWRVALIDRDPLERLRDFLAMLGIEVHIRDFSAGPQMSRPMWKIETRALGPLAVLHDVIHKEIDTRGYRRGFLAGFFDAEGHNGTSLRMSQKDTAVLERVRRYAASLGFDMKLEHREPVASTLRLVGSIAERIRFFGVVRPALRRKVDRCLDRQLILAPEPIEAIEPAGTRDVLDIQTSTGTFYAAGLATHNCYARPGHEYLGFSAGLDFETKILVKHEAPELLRKALAKKSWKPQTIAMSGVTDCYQPVERKLRITRGCLEVLAEFRNPVGIVTKSALVARDADLLAELARHDAAVVNVSLTSLDDGLRRKLEPRAASPKRRLQAIEALAAAGVPVGVMVAPVIPGLNDAEIPALVQAAARAGAQRANLIVLRLPHAVAPLFERWLERHAPLKKDRVLARVREVRGGRLNDPNFHTRMRGAGTYAEQLHELFRLACRRAGLEQGSPTLSTAAFRPPPEPQLSLW